MAPALQSRAQYPCIREDRAPSGSVTGVRKSGNGPYVTERRILWSVGETEARAGRTAQQCARKVVPPR
jgi:hypothetical protein